MTDNTLYNELSKIGQWENFLSYLKRNTNYLEHVKKMEPEILNNAQNLNKNHVSTFFLQHVDASSKFIDDYFNSIIKKQKGIKDQCIRCKKLIRNFDDDICNLCGFSFSELTGLSLTEQQNHVEAFRRKNIHFVKEKLKSSLYIRKVSELSQTFKIEKNEHARLVKENEKLKQKIEKNHSTSLKKVEATQRYKEEFNMLREQAGQLLIQLKNLESLFLPFDPEEINKIIFLRIKGEYLMAKVEPDLTFPIELVAGLQEYKGKRTNPNFENITCFVFIPSNKWQKESYGENNWRLNIRALLGEVLNGDYLITKFSHLHKKKYPYQIRYNGTNKIYC